MLQIEDDCARPGWADVLCMQRAGELLLERAARPRLRRRGPGRRRRLPTAAAATRRGTVLPLFKQDGKRQVPMGRSNLQKMGPGGPFPCSLGRPIIMGPCRCGRRSRSCSGCPRTGPAPPRIDAIESTLTDGYAEALALEAERSRIERRLGEVARDVGDAADCEGVRPASASASRRPTASLHGFGRSSATSRPGVGVRLARLPARRSRCARRRQPPGCGCRSGASSGCSRCGS